LASQKRKSRQTRRNYQYFCCCDYDDRGLHCGVANRAIMVVIASEALKDVERTSAMPL
jgi:hypothetical protein